MQLEIFMGDQTPMAPMLPMPLNKYSLVTKIESGYPGPALQIIWV